MIDVGWSEMAVVALIALLILGPKELPQAMRMVAQWVKKARTVTREFRSGMDDMIREAELEEARGAIDMARPSNLEKTIGSTIDPTGTVSDSLSDVEKQTRKVETEARQAARQDDGDSGSAAAASEDGGGATIVEQPTRVAPPHSLKPPPEPGAEDQDDAKTDNAPTRA